MNKVLFKSKERSKMLRQNTMLKLKPSKKKEINFRKESMTLSISMSEMLMITKISKIYSNT